MKEKWRIILRALKMNEEADKGFTLRTTVCALLLLIQDYVFILLIKYIINGIADGKELSEMFRMTVMLVSVSLLTYIIVKVIRRREECHLARHDMRLRSIFNKKTMSMDYVYLDDPDMQTRFYKCMGYLFGQYGISSVPNFVKYLSQNVFKIVVGIVLIVPSVMVSGGQGGFAGFICSPFGFLSAVGLVIISELIKALVFNEKNNKCFEEVNQDKEQITNTRVYYHYMQHSLKHYQSGKEIRLYGEQELILSEMKRTSERNRRLWLNAYLKCRKYNLGLQLMNLISRGIMYGYAILRAVYGTLSAGEVIAFVMLFTRISTGITGFSDSLSFFRLASAYCKDVFDFLDIPNRQYRGTIPTEKRNDNEYEFDFRHVWFRYPNTEQYVLRDVNMKWRISEKMALVGRNGSGKSTLVKLLCRLYDPTKGEITLNGIDIRKYDYSDYMSLFSVVFQDSKLFSFSVAENVAANTEYDADRVEDCVRRSGMSERLDTLTDGIDTCLYKDFDENGVEISGGEAQKLCLARAVYKGAPFIVLDEPTAALDPISEHDIYTKFNAIVGTRTAVYISHRLSSCRFCDEITVMDNGEIVERGSHGELVMADGHYAKLWSAQAEYYRDTAGELFK